MRQTFPLTKGLLEVYHHTHFYNTPQKTLYWIWVRTRASIPVPFDFFITCGGEPGLRSRYLSTFLSYLVENPGMNLSTSRLFYHIWWRTWASISVLFDFFCHIWWRTRYLLSFLSQIRGHADEYTNNRLNIIKCNVFLQGKWNNCLLNFSLVLVTPRIF